MAFGFSPKYVYDFQFEGIDKEQFLAIALEAASQLNWNVSFISETGFVGYTKFSWSSWSEEVTIKVNDGVANIKSECTGSQIIDYGKNKKNVNRFIEKFNALKSSISPDELQLKVTQLKQNYAPKEEDVLNQPSLTAKEKISGVFSIFIPVKGYFITPILINLNILIFIAMVVSGVSFIGPDNQSLLNWGANFRPLTLEGQWWRLLTCCFIHIGIFHLLLNMYALLYVGLILEPYLGKTRFISAYLLTGIAASVTSLWWHDLTISAGASGAIFGMYGVFLALLTTNLLDKSVKQALLMSVVIFVGYNLVNGLKSGIDNAAHIGGLLSGIVIGYAFVPSLKQYHSATIKLASIGILSAIVIATSFIVYQNLPNDIGKYDEKMKMFSEMEIKALELYKLSPDTPRDKYLSEIKDNGLYYWNENLKLVNGFDSLDLPSDMRVRNGKLKEYCELRIKSYELIYKAVDEKTNVYEGEINECNEKIGKLIDDLSGKE